MRQLVHFPKTYCLFEDRRFFVWYPKRQFYQVEINKLQISRKFMVTIHFKKINLKKIIYSNDPLCAHGTDIAFSDRCGLGVCYKPTLF